eukprot:scaffold109014_cov54-Phaeocystis_antarctica.AAC.2
MSRSCAHRWVPSPSFSSACAPSALLRPPPSSALRPPLQHTLSGAARSQAQGARLEHVCRDHRSPRGWRGCRRSQPGPRQG